MTSTIIDVDSYDDPESEDTPDKETPELPPGMIKLSDKQEERFMTWMRNWYHDLTSAHSQKLNQFVAEEKAYRAKSEGLQEDPFVGASGDVVPIIAMAVDPIVARLDTGIFKANPVFRAKPLRKGVVPLVDSIEKWLEYYQKYQLKLRRVALPRLLELTKHGTMVLKTVYDCDEYTAKVYNRDWEIIEKTVTNFKGPRVHGISLADFIFPPYYQDVQQAPIVFERQRVSMLDLLRAQKAKKLVNVDKLKGQETFNTLNALEQERATSANHEGATVSAQFLEVFEFWCDFDVYDNGVVQRLVGTYHPATHTLLQLRLNYYLHQRKPYTVIPYSVRSDSLYGMGICEMVLPFQDVQTQWQRHALNNAFLANIRMFIASTESKIEAKPKLYSGRVFRTPKPKEDFIPMSGAADIYPSTLTERQNIMGLAEKRTGVSDYLTGRESPIVGSRATATSTLALIQEGTKRVEEVLENIRNGLAEVVEYCMYIWMQYGLGEVDDIVFNGDQVVTDLQSFFDDTSQSNIHGTLTIDLSATDAASNRSVQQQVQLAIIQTMMMYLQKVVELGQMAAQSAQQMPVLVELASEVLMSAKKMFKDLLTKYEVPNPDEYLPDLERFIAELNGGAAPGTSDGSGGLNGEPNLSILSGGDQNSTPSSNGTSSNEQQGTPNFSFTG